MKNKDKDLPYAAPTDRKFRPAVHLDYVEVDDYASDYLSNILKRDIKAEGNNEKYKYDEWSDDWNIEICGTTITESELDILYDRIGADDGEQESQSYTADENDSASELCQKISYKLFSKLLPFDISFTLCDEDGIWFFGSEFDSSVLNINSLT